MAAGTRDRIVREAMALFARKGYASTTVAEIEAAAGLRPGSGGMYRHFPSKEAVLAAGVRAELTAMAEIHAVDLPLDGVDLRDLLTLFARVGLDRLARQRDFHRILYRDLDAFPDLLAEVEQRLVWSSARDMAARLARLHEAGLVRATDFGAVATIAVGALVNRSVVESMTGVPAPVDDDRLVATWVDLFTRYLAPDGENDQDDQDDQDDRKDKEDHP